ncbi:hypothetical protein SAMN05421853_102116 [Roseivivax halotolerans]|uniref:Uncharacterized protein n=1 Tax=Roseivivax halotolerans TaxID=93684 RepID=A0A1I5W474_9RHOB|nr:hypothetical protein [Roseivivax halotolerans]SFQ14519.1 hypothetical protein SAMN05421853_102116 [Roseivivax halotolerans]
MAFQLTLTVNDRQFLEASPEFLADKGVPAVVIGAAIKAAAARTVASYAETYRARLASTSAGKLQAYRVKEEIAREPDTADAAELALIDREAIARSITRDELIGRITAQATAYRQIALLIEAIEAETNAAVSEIPDDASDIEAQIASVLSAAKASADAAFEEAKADIEAAR